MDYKELHQDVYETLCEDLQREPDWKEMREAFRDRLANLADFLIDTDEA